MIVYSQKIIQFLDEIKRMIKNILSCEVGLRVARMRFYDRQQRASYPIKIVVYNTKSMLGYFDADFYELGFHECLMHARKDELLSVVRHEIAHYLTFMEHGPVQAHGTEFRDICNRYGWDQEVYGATMCLEGAENMTAAPESAIFRKVQKLLALASSSNQHEAELAMIKSQQLLLEHNIDGKFVEAEEEKMYLLRLLKQKKQNGKMNAIARILETFFVNTVYSRGGAYIYLEILGTKVNIEIAEYVAAVLDKELDHLWSQAKKTAQLKGMVAKNSFFQGIAKGYCNKLQALKRDYPSSVTNQLLVIEKKLQEAKSMAYPHLRVGYSQRRHCKASSSLGEEMGKSLNIKAAVNGSANFLKKLISFCGS